MILRHLNFKIYRLKYCRGQLLIIHYKLFIAIYCLVAVAK